MFHCQDEHVFLRAHTHESHAEERPAGNIDWLEHELFDFLQHRRLTCSRWQMGEILDLQHDVR